MNLKFQVLALCAAALFAGSAVAAPARSAAKGVRKNVAAIVPDVPAQHLRHVDSSIRPIVQAARSFGAINPLQAALDYARDRLSSKGVGFPEYVVKDSYTTEHNGVTHVYLRQVINGFEVTNGDMNINVLPDGSILSSADSFFSGSFAPEAPVEPESSSNKASFFVKKTPISALKALEFFGRHIGEETVSSSLFASKDAVEEAVVDEHSALIRNVPYAESDVKARMVYIQMDGGKEVKLAWELTVEMEQNWFYTTVDAYNGQVLSVNDWVSQAVPTYRVLPFGVEDPSFGPRELVTETFNTVSSPLGWHDDGSTKHTNTIGNNVDAHSKSSAILGTNRRPEGGANLYFDEVADFTQPAKTYYEAATTNLFYLINRYHDLLYQLGFDEVSGNFQTNNFGKGGKGGDAVIASAQDPSGTNNANFATPADGSPGKMNMYIFTQTNPTRDGDFQSSVVIHEYTHGLSTRLTGGPSNSNCLASGEAGGMGEGWGDAIANAIAMKEEYTRDRLFPVGAYVMGNAVGVRKYAYSTDLKSDPETYGFLKKSGYSEVHNIGEVWAGILNEVYWNLRDARGFQKDLFTVNVKTAEDRANAKGNVIFLLNVVDGMKNQPCSPSFVDARDAILLADKTNFNSENVCLMWKGFAKRGLGVGAKKGGVESFDVPANCQ